MRKITLLTSVLLTAPFAAGNVSAQCVATQDCATLGYTETSCKNDGIKCPFGNYWACKGNADAGTEGSENGRDNPDCTYGAIYYSDGTCVKEFISDKAAMGVVVYDENNEKWIMALLNSWDIVVTACWSTENVDVPEITNHITEQTVINDLKSCENTEAMLALGEEKYPAAKLARDYAPRLALHTKGKWCLPAMGIWYMVNNHLIEINAAFSRAKSMTLTEAYWSSSESNYKSAWNWSSQSVSTSLKYSDGSLNVGFYVRPVMEI